MDKDFKKEFRIIGILFLVVVFVIAGVNTLNSFLNASDDVIDPNVYLNEETCYAGGIYIKADSISVIKNEDLIDGDGDELSPYTLKIGIAIQRRGGNFWTGVKKIRSNYFTLKSVNIEAETKMEVFIEKLFAATLSISTSLAVSGDVNIIEETISFVLDYTKGSIENADNSSVDFKPIKCTKGQFEPYKPKDGEEAKHFMLEFPLKQNYLDSKNLIVLSIDQAIHIEQRIFLITRPPANS